LESWGVHSAIVGLSGAKDPAFIDLKIDCILLRQLPLARSVCLEKSAVSQSEQKTISQEMRDYSASPCPFSTRDRKAKSCPPKSQAEIDRKNAGD
jgi:hypothetical protein